MFSQVSLCQCDRGQLALFVRRSLGFKTLLCDNFQLFDVAFLCSQRSETKWSPLLWGTTSYAVSWVAKGISVQANNQEFFGAGEVSWNRDTSINVSFVT